MSINRVIGDDGDLPWNIPEEFQWFKDKTMGQLLVMGRKTFDSIGKPLPGRETVIVSRSAKASDYPGLEIVREIEQLPLIKTDKEIWICGGSEIYEQTLPLCSDLFLTVVKRKVKGDAYFPDFQTLFDRPETIRDADEFIIYHFKALKERARPD